MKQVLVYKALYSSFFGLLVLITLSCQESRDIKTAHSDKILTEIKSSLDNLVRVWYPIAIDSNNGGFYSDFNFKWEREGEQKKMLVSQARHIWTASALSTFYGDDNYTKIAAHGYNFLKDHMWDKEYGGFHTLLVQEGVYLKPEGNTKSSYGNAFGIYGLAVYYGISKDSAALNLAKKRFSSL